MKSRLRFIIGFFCLLSLCGCSTMSAESQNQSKAVHKLGAPQPKKVDILKVKKIRHKKTARKQKRIQKVARAKKAPSAPTRISIMTYNVDNLFDTNDDPKKSDETFLPLQKKKSKSQKKICNKIVVEKWKTQCMKLDWSSSAYKAKVANIGRVIKSTNHGQGADIVLLQEIENKQVLQDLISGPLKGLGYLTAELIEGNDIRGIDVAVIAKFERAGLSKSFEIPFVEIEKWRKADTRPILKVSLKVDVQQSIDVYSLHLPAPFHPVKFRWQALQYLKKLVDRESKDKLYVIGGDFNFPVEEELTHKVSAELSKKFIVVHKDGCRQCLGTSFYSPRGTWSFLDMLLTSSYGGNKASPSWEVDLRSVRVVNDQQNQKLKNGAPRPFDPRRKLGYSDHFPLYFELAKVQP